MLRLLAAGAIASYDSDPFGIGDVAHLEKTLEWLYAGMRPQFRPELSRKIDALQGGATVGNYGILSNLLGIVLDRYEANIDPEERRRISAVRGEYEAIAARYGWFTRTEEGFLPDTIDAEFPSLTLVRQMPLARRKKKVA